MIDNCGNCIFFIDQGCHRHAPIVLPESLAQWPEVRETEWCGDWEGRPEDFWQKAGETDMSAKP